MGVAEGKDQNGSRTEFFLSLPRWPSFDARNRGLGGRRWRGAKDWNEYQFQSPRRQDNWIMSVGGLKWRGEDGEEMALSLQRGWRTAQPEIPG